MSMRHAALILLLVAGMCGCGKVSAQNGTLPTTLQVPTGGTAPTPVCSGDYGRSDRCRCPEGWEPAIEVYNNATPLRDICSPLQKSVPAPPFDVAPRVSQEKIVSENTDAVYIAGFLDGCKSFGIKCYVEKGHVVEIVPHFTCEDKSRVLLHSEDGKGHCISLKAWE